MKSFLEHRKNTILLLALVNLLLTPIYFYLSGLPSPNPLMLINYAIITVVGYQICKSKKANFSYLVLSLAITISLIGLYLYPDCTTLILAKNLSIASLVLMIFTFLTKALWNRENIDIDNILGVVCGYILIGLFAAQVYEIVYYTIPNSFNFNEAQITDFQFFYYSFTGITTVGFGDITPTSPQSQSITILMNIAGQLYLTIVMAMFVGKFINSKSK